MKRAFKFGKIAYYPTDRKANAVEISVELKNCGGETTFTIDRKTGEKTITGKTPEYMELSICGAIWNNRHTDICSGGQCLDTIAEYRDQLNNPKLFDEIYHLWKNYHLNGMHAGTPEQEKAVKEWKAAGNKYDYTAVCDMLKSRNLYEVNYTGLTVGRRYNNEPYKYGHGWIIQELPNDVLQRVINLGTEAAGND